jgi:hypothetical protein
VIFVFNPERMECQLAQLMLWNWFCLQTTGMFRKTRTISILRAIYFYMPVYRDLNRQEKERLQ